MYNSEKKDLAKSMFFLDVLMNEIDETIIFVDAEGYIEALSLAYAEFLKVDRDDVIGKHVSEVIENTRLPVVLVTGEAEVAQPQKIRGKNMIASRIPIIRDNKVVGAFGRVLFKNVDELGTLYHRINKLEQELNFYESKFATMNVAKYSAEDLVGNSPEIKELRKTVKQVAKSNSNVIIQGESGTGKELVAHAIHSERWGDRRPLICVNCAAIPGELMESELFGYEEGSFTGAKKGGKIGLFQAAHGGTLFLDEIGEMPIHMQVKLLRVLQDKEVQKIGSTETEKVDVRIITATNRDLNKMVENGEFREDLYFRLNVISINIPPLRERSGDIPVISELFLKKMSENQYIFVKGISARAMEYMKSYKWPGNVRELENVLERAANFVDSSGMIKTEHLPNVIGGMAERTNRKTLKETIEETERLLIVDALIDNSGRKNLAAKALGISRTSLYEKIEKYNIDFTR